MRIAFASNYLNHHQLPFCQALLERTEGNFTFIATTPFNEARLAIGYEDMNQAPFVVRAYESEEAKERALALCRDADILIIGGGAPDCYAEERIRAGRITFQYYERILRRGPLHIYTPRALRYYFKNHTRHRRAPVYLLCASAYTAADFHKYLAYPKKTLRWGYFPHVRRYEDPDALLRAKAPASLLFCGRFIDWKHPEIPLLLAKRLKEEGIPFSLTYVGDGEMRGELETSAREWGLDGCVRFVGSVPASAVRAYMEESSIFLFTSDFQEGWGAVLSEAMSAGCAAVASHAIGAAPFLIRHGENGLLYENGCAEDLYSKVRYLLTHPDETAALGRQAIYTMSEEWNAAHAADALLAFAESREPARSGPCSRAPIYKNRWFKEKDRKYRK